jgi:hypothetical protein
LIVRKKQFEYFVKTGKYTEAKLCAEELSVAEGNEARGAMEKMKTGFKESKRFMEIKQSGETEQLEFRLETENGVV